MVEWIAGVASKIVASAAWDGAKGFFARRNDNDQSGLSLNLSGAMPYTQPMAPGIARATELTLGEITELLPENSMEWLHEKDFGSSFRWRMIEFLETFSWRPEVPAREFLDSELERLRVTLITSVKEFLYVVARNTDNVFPDRAQDIRKIPAQHDEH